MLLGARGLFSGKGKSHIPIEWLESTGTQWVDSGFIFDNYSAVETTLAWTRNPSVAYQMGFNNGASSGRVIFALQGGADLVWYPNDSLMLSVSLNTMRLHKLDMLSKTAQIANTTKSFSSSLSGEVLSFHIFARNTASTEKHFCYVRCKDFTFYRNGVVEKHLIPVRIGNVGCYYDEVSRTYHYNQGSGNFILGADL